MLNSRADNVQPTAGHASTLEADLATFGERLRRIESKQEIIEVLSRYSHAIDYGDNVDWIGCFTDDATWELVPMNEAVNAAMTSRKLTGLEELARFIATHTSAPARWHKHCVVEPVVHVDGDTGSCHSYFFTLNDHESGAHVRVFGRYVDVLRRQRDGTWRIASRRCEVEHYHPLAVGDPFTSLAHNRPFPSATRPHHSTLGSER